MIASELNTNKHKFEVLTIKRRYNFDLKKDNLSVSTVALNVF
jgi:hypothetical protein